VYVPKKNRFQNSSDQVINPEEKELIRVIQYRTGTNTLGIVFFCLVFGTFLGTIEDKGHVVIDFFKAVFEVIMRMVSTVMWLVDISIILEIMLYIK
jgi:solute carrier family 1 (high affinity glutamate transporter) protein 2